MIKYLISLVFAATSFTPLAHASFQDPIEQLQENHVSVVQNEFSTLQKEFEKGEATEYDLLDAYKAFYQRDDIYRPELNNWIKSYPNSSSAYLARGVYYRKLGEFRRGTNYISQVPSENIAYMEKMFTLAKQDLEMSLRLDPRSYLAALHLLNIAQFEGDDRAAEKYLALGNAAFPSNFILRARYLIHLTPKWGGSYKDMKNFINKCQDQGLSQDKINMLKAIMSDDQGTLAEEHGNIGKAIEYFINALTLSQSASERFKRSYLGSSERICYEPEYQRKYYCQ